MIPNTLGFLCVSTIVNTQPIPTLVFLTIIPGGRHYVYPNFTYEESESQGWMHPLKIMEHKYLKHKWT